LTTAELGAVDVNVIVWLALFTSRAVLFVAWLPENPELLEVKTALRLYAAADAFKPCA
jgi:hypothetical protein